MAHGYVGNGEYVRTAFYLILKHCVDGPIMVAYDRSVAVR